MIKKEKRLICAFMVFVLICLLFFSSVAFGQLSRPLTPTYGNVLGMIFYKDGNTPFVNPTGYHTEVWLHNGSNYYLGNALMNSSSGYYFSNLNTNDNPYYLSAEVINNSTGSLLGYGIVENIDVTASNTSVVNVTTN